MLQAESITSDGVRISSGRSGTMLSTGLKLATLFVAFSLVPWSAPATADVPPQTAVYGITPGTDTRDVRAASATAPIPGDPSVLEVGKPVEREARPGEMHEYRIRLDAGQYVHVAVAERGIDVILNWIAPDSGSTVFRGPDGTHGIETVDAVAEAAGDYRLQVHAGGDVLAGRYEATVDAVRTATTQDRTLAKARYLSYTVLVHTVQEQYAEAIPVAGEAVSLYEQALGPDAPHVAASLGVLARLVEHHGEYAKAEQLYLRAITTYEKALGPDHPAIAPVASNLGAMFRERRDYAKAALWYTRAIAITERAYGSDDIDLFGPIAELVACHVASGEPAKAEPLYIRSLTILEKAFGSDHGFVMTLLDKMAAFYFSQNALAKAEPLYLRALATRERVIGPEHLEVARTLNNLGVLYRTQGAFAKAEPYFVRSLEILEKTIDPKVPGATVDLAQTQSNLAKLYLSQGMYAKAEALLLRALALREAALPPDALGIAQVNQLLGWSYVQQGAYAKAEALLLEARTVVERILGLDHVIVASVLNDLGELYERQGRYAKAEPLYMRVLGIQEAALGPEHPNLVLVLNNTANLYQKLGQYVKAEPLYVRSLAIGENALGAEHPDLATVLNNLANVHYRQGHYAKAERLYERSLAIHETALGPDHSDLANPLNNLAAISAMQGRYAKAESLYGRSLAIGEKSLGPEHPDVAVALGNLAILYLLQGEHARAEPLYLRALAIVAKALGSEHPEMAASLCRVAYLCINQGQYARAAGLYMAALAIQEKALGPEHPEVAATLNGLAILYEKQNQVGEAERLNARALAIQERAFGPDHPHVALTLGHLADLYSVRGQVAIAEQHYVRALRIREKALGPDHPEVAQSLDSLAVLYLGQGEFAKAEPLLARSLAVFEKALGSNHSHVAEPLGHRAVLRAHTGRAREAVEDRSRANQLRERGLSLNLVAGSEDAKLQYLQRFVSDIDGTLLLHIGSAPRDPKAIRMAVEIVLQRKGRALDEMTDSIARLRRRASPEDQKLLDELASARSRFSTLTLRGSPVPHELTERIDALEAQASRRSVEFRAQSAPVTLDAVQKAVPADARLLEFVVYRQPEFKDGRIVSAEGVPHYAVYVVGSTSEPRWIDLGEAAPIDQAVGVLLEALRDPKRTDTAALARSLDERLMRPVRALLGDAHHLLVSPDGALNLVPFAALVDETNRYLAERYLITYLTSGRDLLRLTVEVESRQNPLVLANPDFGPGPEPGTEARREIEHAEGPKRRVALFQPLPGTAAEAEELATLMPDATVLTGARATEEALKQVKAPALLHLATHGFFLDDLPASPFGARELKVRPSLVSNLEPPSDSGVTSPLLRSGLALAGANRPTTGANDGVVTAIEVAGLDMWGTDLVVLSACRTGVGTVLIGEGVFGLRRALVLAGSESQVMTLWSVADTATRELMVAYYRRLKAGEGRGEALRRVQLEMLKDPARRHPYFWAAFIESGAWAPL